MKNIDLHLGVISEALFDAVSEGKITTQEYKTACDGLRIINKVIK